MAVLLVTYDMNKEPNSEQYKGLLAYIKSFSWARMSESSYAIDTQLSPEQVYAKLKPFVDDNDNILVMTLKRPYSGYNRKDVIDWLNARLTF